MNLPFHLHAYMYMPKDLFQLYQLPILLIDWLTFDYVYQTKKVLAAREKCNEAYCVSYV